MVYLGVGEVDGIKSCCHEAGCTRTVPGRSHTAFMDEGVRVEDGFLQVFLGGHPRSPGGSVSSDSVQSRTEDSTGIYDACYCVA